MLHDNHKITPQKPSVIQRLNAYFEKSDLPDGVDEDFVNELLLEVRDATNQNK